MAASDPERLVSDDNFPLRLLSSPSTVILVPEPTTDPKDPLNWSFTRKAVHALFVYILTIIIFATGVHCGNHQTSHADETVELNMAYAQLNSGISCNVAGLAVGSFIFVPFTKKYGRRSTYVISTAVLVGTAWWSDRMNTVSEMYMTNLFFGLAGSANETVAEMTANLFFVHQRGMANGLYIISVMLGNILIPTISGVQAEAQGWRWAYYTTAICLTIMTFVFLFFFEETKYFPVSVGQSSQAGPHEVEGMEEPPAFAAFKLHGSPVVPLGRRASATTLEPPRMETFRQRMQFLTLTSEPLFRGFVTPFQTSKLLHVLFTAVKCANAIFFLVLMSSVNPIVFSAPPYSFGTAGVDLMLVGPFIGNAIGVLYGGFCGDWVAVRLAKRSNGVFEPEFRLYTLALSAVLMGSGLAIYGVALDRGMHWIYPSIGSAMYAFSMGAIMDISFTVVIDTYTDITADCFVFINFVRNAGTIALPFGIVPWLDSMSLTYIFVICGCISSSIALLFIPPVIWGKALRKVSERRYEGSSARQSC
ncbi:putative MFS-type transporter [Colletotrichum shisoi]|uniref:Putative MFS-type transporter n=1 Tax=Colletotrichum shisoi TaxID=2078593 RepID=A0A5Q4BS57_9PEZI|nr:putative MFS-type transporter [Colletotrichum shisoi]